jgi:hypothetical protein
VSTRYVCASWQGLLQQLVYLIGRGYFFYHVTYLPVNKKEKYSQIDAKLIGKYKTDKTKWQRSRLKAKGVANFYYLRWKHVAVILHTLGEQEDEIIYDDKFLDIRKNPLLLKISELVAFNIQIVDRRVTVKLAKDTYEGLRIELHQVAKTKSKEKMAKAFDRINGFPAWAGIIVQKRRLAWYLCEQAKKHNIQLDQSELRFVDQRKPVKVFQE